MLKEEYGDGKFTFRGHMIDKCSYFDYYYCRRHFGPGYLV